VGQRHLSERLFLGTGWKDKTDEYPSTLENNILDPLREVAVTNSATIHYCQGKGDSDLAACGMHPTA
jgi:hypothetical protein